MYIIGVWGRVNSRNSRTGCPASRKLANLTHLGERLGGGLLSRQDPETARRLCPRQRLKFPPSCGFSQHGGHVRSTCCAEDCRRRRKIRRMLTGSCIYQDLFNGNCSLLVRTPPIVRGSRSVRASSNCRSLSQKRLSHPGSRLAVPASEASDGWFTSASSRVSVPSN
jgi:hypothetical protein